MLFAAMTAQDWILIIGAVFLGIGQLFQMYLTYKKGKDAQEQGARTETKIAEVKQEVKDNTEITNQVADTVSKLPTDPKK